MSTAASSRVPDSGTATRQVFRLAFAGLALTAFAGCAKLPIVALTADAAQQLRGRSVARTKAETPSFVATTAANASFALVGALAAISAGNELIKANGVEDPAIKISEALGASLADKYHGEIKATTGGAVGDAIEQVIAAAPTADMILDVRTIGWRFGYFSTSWGTYYVAYVATARLIDVKTKAVVAQSICTGPKPEKTDKSPSYDGLVANGAQGLKRELKSIADRCVSKFKRDMRLTSAEDRLVENSGDRSDEIAASRTRMLSTSKSSGELQASVGAVPRNDMGLRAPLRRGDVLEYTLTDDLTGNAADVSYRLDRIDDNQLAFNMGSRIERPDGHVVSIKTPAGGLFETISPPGGWVRDDAKPGMSWDENYANVQLHVHVDGEETVVVAGESIVVWRLICTGWRRYVPLKATLLYSPELKRVVLSEIETRVPGSGSGSSPWHETFKLARISRN